jgi:type IV pilus assembly protein PilB
MVNEIDVEKAYKFLESKKKLNKKDIAEAYKKAKGADLDIFNVLIDNKKAGEEEMTKLKAIFLGIPYFDLKDLAVDGEVLKEVPEKAAIFYKFMPFEKKDNIVKFAMVEPTNAEAIDAIKFISVRRNFSTNIFLVSRSGFNNAVKQYTTLSDELSAALQNVDKKIEEKKDEKKDQKEEVKRIVEEAPVSKIVDIIISHAVEGKASDIHIEPSQNELRIRYRLDGVLHDSLVLPKKISAAIVSRIKILSDLKIDETRKPQDGRFRFNITDSNGMEKSVDLRISTLPTVNGEKVVMRILDTSSDISSLENLGIWGRDLEVINSNISKPFGIILITGPTGSGKSTTLYAILKMLNQEGVNIITLEDPVEYYLEGVNQSQIRSEIGYSFAAGLRSILRQDPDIIMVGEIRDKETAELATHAALTGHLVLSTLHTNNAIGVVPRLIDMGIEPFLISSSLNVAIGQRLVRKICKYCKEEIKPTKVIEEIIRTELKDVPIDQLDNIDIKKDIRLYKGKGCRECKNSGTSGRVGVYEVLSMTQELEAVISAKITDKDIEIEADRQGMRTMKQDGIIKALRGITTIEEVFRATED